jgi:hypothetical protein
MIFKNRKYMLIVGIVDRVIWRDGRSCTVTEITNAFGVCGGENRKVGGFFSPFDV